MRNDEPDLEAVLEANLDTELARANGELSESTYKDRKSYMWMTGARVQDELACINEELFGPEDAITTPSVPATQTDTSVGATTLEAETTRALERLFRQKENGTIPSVATTLEDDESTRVLAKLLGPDTEDNGTTPAVPATQETTTAGATSVDAESTRMLEELFGSDDDVSTPSVSATEKSTADGASPAKPVDTKTAASTRFCGLFNRGKPPLWLTAKRPTDTIWIKDFLAPVPKFVMKNTIDPAKKQGFIPRPIRNMMNAAKNTTNNPTPKVTTTVVPSNIRRRKSSGPPKVGGYFHDLPPEIRLKIFGYCLDDTWNGRSPAIIRVLRLDPIIYPEIMECWYKSDNVYHLNQRNGWSFCSMSKKAIDSVRKIKIEIKEYHPPPPKHPHRAWTQVPKPKKITKLYHKAENIEEITIQSCMGGQKVGIVVPSVIKVFKHYLVNTKKLRVLDVDFRFLDAHPSLLADMRLQIVPEINRLLGEEGVENRTEQMRRLRRSKIYACVWHWETPTERKKEGSKEKPEVKYFTQITRERLMKRD